MAEACGGTEYTGCRGKEEDIMEILDLIDKEKLQRMQDLFSTGIMLQRTVIFWISV